MKENKIESFQELEGALSNLSSLAEEITSTLNVTNTIFEEQKQGWYSANSNLQSQKMMNYADEATKIAKNVREVSGAIDKFKTATHNIDELK